MNASATIRGKTSPYGFFVKMCYEEHRRKFPQENVLVTEISKKCSQKWKEMNDMEKKRFFELAQKDAERYQAEVQAQGGPQTMRKKRAKKDPQAPKRALSAFFFFSNERRGDVQSKYPAYKVGQVAQELGRAWKALSEEERAVYEKRASEDKDRYNEEMKSYREAGPSTTRGMINNVQQSANILKIDDATVQDMNNQPPQTVQVQYVDQAGNIIHVINQPAFVTGDNNTVYMNNEQTLTDTGYENA